MEREASVSETSEVSEEWVLAEILGDHPGWEDEAVHAEAEVREIAQGLGAGFFVFQNCPPAPDGTPCVRIIAYTRSLRDAYEARHDGKNRP